VLELEDLEDGALDVDVVAVLELVGGDRGNQPLLQAKSSSAVFRWAGTEVYFVAGR